ncbi:MAG: hypothetical protein ACI4SD_08460 [Suilimivivens sp.]
MEDKKVRLNEQNMEYKKGFKWVELPYREITKAYLRIEEVNGTLCCGRANFDMYFLMLQLSTGELLKLECTSKESVKEMLEVLKQKNDKIEIGYKAKEEEE